MRRQLKEARYIPESDKPKTGYVEGRTPAAERPLGIGKLSMVRTNSLSFWGAIGAAILATVLALACRGGTSMPSDSEPEGGRRTLLQNHSLEPFYGVAIGCDQCAVKPEGPGLLEAEFRWDAGGAKYFALVFHEVDADTRLWECGETWQTPEGDICFGLVHENDQGKNPWILRYEIPGAGYEYAIDFVSRGPGFPSGLLTIWFTSH